MSVTYANPVFARSKSCPVCIQPTAKISTDNHYLETLTEILHIEMYYKDTYYGGYLNLKLKGARFYELLLFL